jgi:hypothetical protein
MSKAREKASGGLGLRSGLAAASVLLQHPIGLAT